MTRDADGVIVDTRLTTLPQPGSRGLLTVDSLFQQAVDPARANNLDWINERFNKDSAKAAAGAVVVLNVKDGSVAAASKFPSFDQNLYAAQYGEYSKDPGLPLFNRALQGL